MNRVLLVYGTKTGCTREIAERIGERLRLDGATAEVFSADEAPTPEGYNAVVVGSGVRMSQWHAPVRNWVATNAEALRTIPVASYTACLTIVSEPEKVDEMRSWSKAVEDAAGLTVVDSGLFAGWFEPKQFGFLERTILKGMKSPQGDFRDFAAIDAWTDSVAPKLGLSPIGAQTV
jgi:menaquinone-dependent protoporphyrinogen oxidase